MQAVAELASNRPTTTTKQQKETGPIAAFLIVFTLTLQSHWQLYQINALVPVYQNLFA